MAKKQKNKKINVISIIVLVLLGFVGVGLIFNAVNNSTKDDKEPNEETPIVETLKLAIIDEDDESIIYNIEYVEGMTWGEWVDSDYNTLGITTKLVTVSDQYKILKIKGQYNNDLCLDDLVGTDTVYYFRSYE